MQQPAPFYPQGGMNYQNQMNNNAQYNQNVAYNTMNQGGGGFNQYAPSYNNFQPPQQQNLYNGGQQQNRTFNGGYNPKPWEQNKGGNSYKQSNTSYNGGYNGFTTSEPYTPSNFKIPNMKVDSSFTSNQTTNAPAPAMGANAPWKKFTKAGGFSLPAKDPIVPALEKCGVSNKEEQDKIKDLITLVKAAKEGKET